MYKAELFEITDLKILKTLVEQFPLATVCSVTQNVPLFNFLPFIVEDSPDQGLVLLSHMAKSNPLSQQIKDGATVGISFLGPNTYINPNWYQKNDAPTWNYINATASGPVELIEDHVELLKILKKTTDLMNQTYEDKWDFFIPDDLRTKAAMASAVVGFKMKPDRFIGKFKISQDRPKEDQMNVIRALKTRNDENSKTLALWMEKVLGL
jgi:transcriptional regulator